MSAVMSDCGKYRYELRRQLSDLDSSVCVFIMLNPSTADAELDDPTIRRCKGFASRLGCGELIVVNLFALRSTNPRELYAAGDPVGELNHEYVVKALDEVLSYGGFVICAWGTHGKLMEQDETVLGWIEGESVSGREINPYCFGVTKSGFPKHPLYLPNNSELLEYTGRTNHANPCD